MIAVFLLLAATSCVVAAGCLYADHRLRRESAGRHRKPFADPADETDPDGAQWVEELRGPPPDPPVALSAPVVQDYGIWMVTETVPGRPTLADLVRVRDKLTALPPAPQAVTETQPLPVAICELGMPTEEYVDQLFAKYAEVTQ